MKKAFLLIFVFSILAGGAYWYANVYVPLSGFSQTYSNDEYGISFKYPDTYEVVERDDSSWDRYHYIIAVVDKVALARMPQNGEGPPAITFDIFQNDIDQASAESWIRGNIISNFKFTLDGELSPRTVDGASGLSYRWDGLYRGESVVFSHKDNIVMASVTFISPKDQMYTDFSNVLSTVTLY